jgi:hypothetical protein
MLDYAGRRRWTIAIESCKLAPELPFAKLHQKLRRQPSQYAPIWRWRTAFIRLRIFTAKAFETPILIRV